MHISPTLERAKAYLDVQISRPRTPPGGVHLDTEGPFVTISRESGVGGSEFATDLGRRLDIALPSEGVRWTVFDQRIVEEVLREDNLSPGLARFLPEDRIHEITGTVGEIVGLHPNLWSLAQKTNALLRNLARRGHTILVGRGGVFASAGIEGGVHVRLVAREDTRIRRTMATSGLGYDEAQAFVRRTETARAKYVRSVFGRRTDDPSDYDLVLNVETLSRDTCLALVTRALEARALAQTV
ncbi:cytidylate kinase-like family protein [Opitutales bacterium ASA1]|uniref:cytidylate kinase-like family protein n=1 Tax=Congregicoccus parvus TaxID=3081749 RepID=UPI002B2DA271|nr:cytidylate kinase-like family protein [Opitutales bacterium ASA1]